MNIIYLFLVLVFFLILIKATDLLIVNLKAFSKVSRMGDFVVTTLLLALATSLPEFFVGLLSALKGQPNLSLGNIIGANIANLTIVTGGAALIGGGLAVRGIFLRRDVFFTFLAGAAPLLLLLDRDLDRVDGIILLILYSFYSLWVLSERRRGMNQDQKESVTRHFFRELNYQKTKKEILFIFLGIFLLLFSADMIVRLATKIALSFNLPVFLIGLFLVSLGTTLPELVFEIKAIQSHKTSMVFGNLLGSIVANSTLIIGIVAIISPIKIKAFDEYLLATIVYVIVFMVFYFFIRTKRRLDRFEAALLIGFYLAFLISEFIHP